MNKIVFYEKNNLFMLPIPRNGFTINETNQDFSETLFTNWSYPFESFLTQELIRIYGDPSNINTVFEKRKDWGFISVEGTIYPACLKFMGCNDTKIKLQIEFGYESLEVFEKKLTELPLHIEYNGFITQYPKDSLSLKFPEVNIAFPQVEIKRWKDDLNNFERKGIYNNYDPIVGNFTSNYDTENDQWYSLKPFVYLMHILYVGFKSENLELAGDILSDPELRYALLNHTNIPYEKVEYDKEKKVTVTMNPDPAKFTSGKKYQVTSEVETSTSISGEYYFSVLESAEKIVYFKAEISYIDFSNNSQYFSLELSENQTIGEIDVQKLLPNLTGFISVTIKVKSTIEYEGLFNDVKRDLSVFLIKKGDNPGYAYLMKDIDIKAKDYVPDMTFSYLINAIKKTRKYRISILGNKIYFMNSGLLNTSNKNLSGFDTSKKEIIPNEREGYVIQLASPEEYKHTKYLINTKEILTEFEENDNYEKLEIECYPLPVSSAAASSDDVITAVELVEENTIVSLLRYEGLQDGFNRCLNMNTFLIPHIYGKYYNYWIQGRLTAVPYKWKFYSDNFLLRDLTSYDIVYAYQNYNIIIDMQKKFIGETAYEIELKTENRP